MHEYIIPCIMNDEQKMEKDFMFKSNLNSPFFWLQWNDLFLFIVVLLLVHLPLYPLHKLIHVCGWTKQSFFLYILYNYRLVQKALSFTKTEIYHQHWDTYINKCRSWNKWCVTNYVQQYHFMRVETTFAKTSFSCIDICKVES